MNGTVNGVAGSRGAEEVLQPMMDTIWQMAWFPVSMFTGWMNLAMRGMQPLAGGVPCCGGAPPPPGGQGAQAQGVGNAPGSVFPEVGSSHWNPGGHGGAPTKAKGERKMSDCCCHDEGTMVKLVEYTIVTIKRCRERILKKAQKIYADEMTEEEFNTWVIALYCQETPEEQREAAKGYGDDEDWEPITHGDKRYLRVFSQVLQSWPRQQKDCCADNQVDVLRGIEVAIRNLSGSITGSGGGTGGGGRGRREEVQA